MVRISPATWGVEREPRFGIVRLDSAKAAKGQPPLDELAYRFGEIPHITEFCALAFADKVQQLRDEGLVNSRKVVDFYQITGLSGQSCYEGAFELEEDEALITEVRIPRKARY